MLLSLIKQQNKGENDRRVNTTFLTIQQVTKSGRFIGTNRLKHAITAMLELRLENPKNVYSDRYAVFSKHRRGDVGVRLYYDLRRLQSTASSSLRNFADQFDKIFNGKHNEKTTGINEGIES